MSQAPNLTRAQASERSATVTVSSYEITIDLTDGTGGPGEKTFRTDTEVRFDAEPGASTFIDFVGDGIAQATLNGRDLDVGSWTNSGGLPLHDLAATNRLTSCGWSARMATSATAASSSARSEPNVSITGPNARSAAARIAAITCSTLLPRVKRVRVVQDKTAPDLH